MKAIDVPTSCHPDWNRFRSQVIAAVTDVEAQMQQLGKSLTCEVAPRLGLAIDTPDDFVVLEELVWAVRPIALEALRCTREEQGGQFALLLL